MDYLQIALIVLIILLSIFLTITGIQVFLILKDLKSALDRFNKVVQTGGQIVSDIERPVGMASELVSAGITAGAKTVTNYIKKEMRPKKRFYKKVL